MKHLVAVALLFTCSSCMMLVDCLVGHSLNNQKYKEGDPLLFYSEPGSELDTGEQDPLDALPEDKRRELEAE